MPNDQKLRRIKETFDPSMDEEALALDNPVTSLDFKIEAHTEPVTPGCTLKALEAVVSRGLKEFTLPSEKTAIDTELAIEVHKALPIGRQTAADKRVWWFLGLKYSEFVCHRFKPQGGVRTEDRFLGTLTGREPRNAFARLWWVCELTVAPERDYTLTEELLGLSTFQELIQDFGGRHFGFHRPTLEAFIREAGDKSKDVRRATAKIMGNVFSTLTIEALNSKELSATVGEIVPQVEKQLEAEKAADAKRKAEAKKKSG